MLWLLSFHRGERSQMLLESLVGDGDQPP